MRRIHKQGTRQVWLGSLHAPYIVDSPFGGESVAVLVSWGSELPRDLQRESFARRLLASGANEVILVGADADELGTLIEWASASRFPQLEVPRGQELPIASYDSSALAAAVTHLARTRSTRARSTDHFLVLDFGHDEIRSAEIERFVTIAFGGLSADGGAITPTSTIVPSPRSVVTMSKVATKESGSKLREQEHPAYFETGRWRFAGAECDAVGFETPIAGRLEVVRSATEWTVDAPLGSAHLTLRLAPAPAATRAITWRGESREFGILEGSTAVAGDCVLTTFSRMSSDGKDNMLVGSDVAIRRSPVLYEVRGAVMEGGRLLTAWHGELRKTTALS